MASTRMRVSNSVQVYHRIAEDNDMGQHDIGTNDGNVSGLGGSGDFELEADSNVTYNVALSTHFDNTAGGTALASNAISKFIFIKNTGYTSSTKATTSDGILEVALGGTPSATKISLESGESICLHGMGTDLDNTDDYKLRSSTANNVYAEIVFL
tara:strand:- start:2195 stop:2659 length:465 start_codon:yes stop_codon:yes gene_type:complete